MSEISELSGQKSVTMLEKASFSQKCSRLSQYLKEKGSFGDLSLGMTCNTEPNETHEMFRQTATTLNFFPVIEKSRNIETPTDLKSINFFPQQAGFGSSHSEEVLPKMTDSGVNKSAPGEPERAQMTIFYGGQVIVFNDFPADKAKEVMHLAGKETSQSHPTHANDPVRSTIPFPSHFTRKSTDSGNSIPPSPNVVPNFGNQAIQECIQPPSRPAVCELPIARKASLHRFLEKRKDRIGARAPYQTSNIPTGAPSKQGDGRSWLDLAAQSTH